MWRPLLPTTDLGYGNFIIIIIIISSTDRLCGLVVRVLATDPEVPGSIPDATRFCEK
jgi:hypothetical protein